jgi:thiol:disulfide interchange protein DsbC
VIGWVYDMEARQDLTAARLLALNRTCWQRGSAAQQSETQADGSPSAAAASACNTPPRHVPLGKLPAKGAITWGPTNGPCRRLSDFHCGYCKKLEAELKAIGARVEERPISIFGAESRRDAERVLCSPRPESPSTWPIRAWRCQSQTLRHERPRCQRGLRAGSRLWRHAGDRAPADGAVLEGFALPQCSGNSCALSPPLLPKDSPMRFSTRLLACACLSGRLRHVRHQCGGRFHLPRAEGRLRTDHVIDAKATGNSEVLTQSDVRQRSGVVDADTSRARGAHLARGLPCR